MKVNFHTEFVGQMCVQVRPLDPWVTNLNDTVHYVIILNIVKIVKGFRRMSDGFTVCRAAV